MKILITENKFEQVVENHLNHVYDVNLINSRCGEDDFGNEFPSARVFYFGDYFDDEVCFYWYDKEYWFDEQEYDSDNVDQLIESSPLLQFANYSDVTSLNSLFGKKWEEPFKKWFEHHFGLPIKTFFE